MEEVTTTTITRIERLGVMGVEDIGKFVKLYGWVYSCRTQGAGTLVFVDIDDGTCEGDPVRAIAHKAIAQKAIAQKQMDEDSDESADLEYGSIDFSDIDPLSADEERYTVLTFDQMCEAQHLSVGCSVMLYGKVVDPPPRTTQTFEIKILKLFVVGKVEDPSKYPIQKSILKKPVALRPYYHARFRAPLIQRLMQIRSQALFAVHEFFHKEDVPLIDPSIMTSSDCEGAGEIFKVSPQFFSSAAIAAMKGDSDQAFHEVGLTVSSQLPLEAISMGTGSVYTCQKSFRAEESDTSKHLCEFLHVEFEKYFITLDTLIDFTERFVKYLIRTILDRCKAHYDFLDDDKKSPVEFHGHREFLQSLLDKPFVRIKHADAIRVMQEDLKSKVQVVGPSGKMVRLKFKEFPKQGEDLGAEHEKYLVEKYGTFVFVTHWPSAIKSFYMKQVGDGTCEAFDLLAPLVGELFGGSMREWRYEVLKEEMSKRRMDMGPLQWFVDLRKDGTAPHGGWGMGFDRLVMFLTGMASVRDIVPYPVYYGHCPY